MTDLKTALRPLVPIAWSPVAHALSPVLERSRDGRRLRPGITAVVVARNEAYTIPFSLRSILRLADQIVCVDNLSSDATLMEMERFREEHGEDVEVDIVSMAGGLLDCREEGLRRSRRQWQLRWDADFVAHTSGECDIATLRHRVLGQDRARAIKLPYVNIYGDLRHTLRLNPHHPGERYLMRFGRAIKYRELGSKYEEIRIPRYYELVDESRRYFFHLGGLKSDANLMHRFHFFAWRAFVNRAGDCSDPELLTLEGFTRRRNVALFGTTDAKSLKFRYQRQLCYHLARHDDEQYGAFPQLLHAELARPDQRFEVVYRDGRPWVRVDHEDSEMVAYEPTDADLAWDPEMLLRELLTPEQTGVLEIDEREG